MEPGGGTSPDAAQGLHQDPQQGPASVHVQEHLNDEKMRMCVALQQWRSHLEQMHQHNQAISSLTEDSKVCWGVQGGCLGGGSRGVCLGVFTSICVCVCVAQSFLTRLQQDLSKAVEKVSSREKYISKQLEPLIQEYRSVRARLQQVKTPPTSGQHLAPPAHTPGRCPPAGARALPADQRTSDGEEAGAEGGE